MKVSGFAICRNSIKLAFPFRESIRSLAPFCDEIVVAVGDSTDGTREALVELGKTLICPLKIIDSPWDTQSLKGGLELSRQTNIALEACENDICFYLQSDEVLHEEDSELIKQGLEDLFKSNVAASLSLGWLHFYGDPNTIIHSRRWYRREIRAIKKSSGLKSYGDAQGFRKFSEKVGANFQLSHATRACFTTVGYVRPI